ncbi:hypothetical protein TNCV_819501 [Trichonephila clavipes]|nr:hypothetical protein TNCV_819501 [Trichonephila clavipes]
MTLRHHWRQYEQLSEFESGRIIEMMESRWSSQQMARPLGSSNFTVRRCWDQWIRYTATTLRQDHLDGSGEKASQAAEIANGVYGADTVTANYVQF